VHGVRRREAKAADAPSIEVMGGDHAFTIADQDRRHSTVSTGGEVRVMVTKRLFVLFKSVAEDKVLPEIQPYKPRILKTSLSNEAEAKLTAALSKVA
jgi:hypothetical protein